LKTSFGGTKKLLLYINLTKVVYNMRPTLFLKLDLGIHFTMHQLIPCILLLFSSLGKLKGFAKEEEGIMAQTHNVVAKYWGKGGISKWAKFLCSRAYFWNGAPTPSFIGQKR
jgi:hypothetical protein